MVKEFADPVEDLDRDGRLGLGERFGNFQIEPASVH